MRREQRQRQRGFNEPGGRPKLQTISKDGLKRADFEKRVLDKETLRKMVDGEEAKEERVGVGVDQEINTHQRRTLGRRRQGLTRRHQGGLQLALAGLFASDPVGTYGRGGATND